MRGSRRGTDRERGFCLLDHRKIKSDFEQDVVALESDPVTPEFHRGVVHVKTSGKIVFPSMPGTYDSCAVNFTLTEWSTLMEAAVIDRVKVAIGMEHSNLPALGLDCLARVFGNLAAPGCSNNLRQLAGSSSSVFSVDFDVIVA
jgi:hypothetical protein